MSDETAARFLLLLPPLPRVSDEELLTGAYGDTIKQVLKEVELASQETTAAGPAAVLEIALACPHLIAGPSKNFSHYNATQRALARVYRTICVIAARDGINIEDASGVDVRVLPVAWGPQAASAGGQTTIATLNDLAASGRAWQYAFGVENEDGEAFVKAFVEVKQAQAAAAAAATQQQVQSVVQSRTENASSGICVAVGGTFDHLHIGHKLLLSMTILAASDSAGGPPSVIVGITGDALLKNKKYAEQLESWQRRQESVVDFVESLVDFSPKSGDIGESSGAEQGAAAGVRSVITRYPNGLTLRCVEIQDAYGPTVTEEQIDALVISAETRAGGKAINEKREQSGWRPLEIFEVDVLDADEHAKDSEMTTATREDFASKISSTEIRRRLATKAPAPS